MFLRIEIPFDLILLNHKKPSFLCYFLRSSMGYYYYKPRPCDARTPNVVLILALALILLSAPKLFSSQPEEETKYTSPFVALILIVLILLVLSLLGTSRRKVFVKPPFCQ
ncbi:hypothetical protein PHAVU_011G026200 [Phaseolus vulgaris]